VDKFEKLISKAQVAVAIIGNPQTSDFVFVDAEPLTDTRRELTGRGMRFLGVFGVVQGVLDAALAEPLELSVITALARVFIGRVEGAVTAALDKPIDDSAGWCERLYWLPDTRD
jgi:hypothetical protein